MVLYYSHRIMAVELFSGTLHNDASHAGLFIMYIFLYKKNNAPSSSANLYLILVFNFFPNLQIPITRLLLLDVVKIVSHEDVVFDSGVVLKALKTLKRIEVSHWDSEKLCAKCYHVLIKMIANSCPAIQNAL